MYVAPSDFMALTHGGVLCDAKDRLGVTEFELAMREQLRLYAQVEIDNFIYNLILKFRPLMTQQHSYITLSLLWPSSNTQVTYDSDYLTISN